MHGRREQGQRQVRSFLPGDGLAAGVLFLVGHHQTEPLGEDLLDVSAAELAESMYEIAASSEKLSNPTFMASLPMNWTWMCTPGCFSRSILG